MNGLRVTDDETMEIAEMVLSRVNKQLVTMVEELGVKAVGISGKDGGLLQVEKKYADGQDIGYVGNITKVDPCMICWRRTSCRSLHRLVWMISLPPIISMQMMQPVRLPKQSVRTSWYS